MVKLMGKTSFPDVLPYSGQSFVPSKTPFPFTHLQQTPMVYKKCHQAEGCDMLKEEYRQLKIINHALSAAGNSILAPTAYDFYPSADSEFWDDGAFAFPVADAARTCVYSMSRVYPLPTAVRTKLVDLFSPEHLRPRASLLICKGHHLARLLLGHTEPDAERTAPQRFFETYNFPLTRDRAERLGIDTVQLAGEMGRMLAQMHMTAKNDARDIEVVLGANFTDTMRHCDTCVWVIDFNQVRYFDFTKAQIPLLVQAFFLNDAYFPRARLEDSLYKTFAENYGSECDKVGPEAANLGRQFISALELEQVLRDRRSKRAQEIQSNVRVEGSEIIQR